MLDDFPESIDGSIPAMEGGVKLGECSTGSNVASSVADHCADISDHSPSGSVDPNDDPLYRMEPDVSDDWAATEGVIGNEDSVVHNLGEDQTCGYFSSETYQLGYPENSIHSLSTQIVPGPKYPKNDLLNDQSRSIGSNHPMHIHLISKAESLPPH